MNDERLQDLYHRAMARRAAQTSAREISPEAMVDVLTGQLPEAERQRVLLAIMSDRRCRQEFELLRAVVEGASPAEPARLRPVRNWARLGLAAGVALIIGAALLWRAKHPEQEPIREGSQPGEVQLMAPESGTTLVSDLRFVWRSVPGALRYEYSLVTKGGRLVFSATLVDTALALPSRDSLPLRSDDELRWWVEATLGDGHQSRSVLRHLKVTNR